MKEMLRRYLPLWIGIAVFGLAIGLPFGWGFSQFHHSSQVPREAAEPPAQAQSGQAQSPETYWGRLTTDPSAGGTLLLCLITAVLAGYTYRLFRATADLARDTRTASDAALTASTEGLLVARSALIATNRAWIHSPEVFVGSQPLLFYSKDRPSIGAQASVAIRITNVGNAPAIRVTMHTRLMAGMGAGVFPEFVLGPYPCQTYQQPADGRGIPPLAATKGWHLPSVQFLRHGVIADKAGRPEFLNHRCQGPGAHVSGTHVRQCTRTSTPPARTSI
jgi:hypothetical protein